VWGVIGDCFKPAFHEWLEGGVGVKVVFCPVMQYHTLPYGHRSQVHAVFEEPVVGSQRVASMMGDNVGDGARGEGVGGVQAGTVIGVVRRGGWASMVGSGVRDGDAATHGF
jgi:hypothetical protein